MELKIKHKFKCIKCDKELKYTHSNRKPENENFEGGDVALMKMGYGSTLDGDKYWVALCDNCIKANPDKVIYCGNYLVHQTLGIKVKEIIKIIAEKYKAYTFKYKYIRSEDEHWIYHDCEGLDFDENFHNFIGGLFDKEFHDNGVFNVYITYKGK